MRRFTILCVNRLYFKAERSEICLHNLVSDCLQASIRSRQAPLDFSGGISFTPTEIQDGPPPKRWGDIMLGL